VFFETNLRVLVQFVSQGGNCWEKLGNIGTRE
jgi:hypothetical protein